MKAAFPSWQDCLDEFAAGQREYSQQQRAVPVSPYLRQVSEPLDAARDRLAILTREIQQ